MAVAQLLECETDYAPFPYTKKTRWNNRSPGNGRFKNFGLARFYSPDIVHIAIYSPIKIYKILPANAAIELISMMILQLKDTE